mmetsp:Transcript_12050/g.36298  ORF Transcript_12050/g.36298 Transcript_12050/m.36298 type:complete len:336 (+) Transcript_12050:256-1263(+)
MQQHTVPVRAALSTAKEVSCRQTQSGQAASDELQAPRAAQPRPQGRSEGRPGPAGASFRRPCLRPAAKAQTERTGSGLFRGRQCHKRRPGRCTFAALHYTRSNSTVCLLCTPDGSTAVALPPDGTCGRSATTSVWQRGPAPQRLPAVSLPRGGHTVPRHPHAAADPARCKWTGAVQSSVCPAAGSAQPDPPCPAWLWRTARSTPVHRQASGRPEACARRATLTAAGCPACLAKRRAALGGRARRARRASLPPACAGLGAPWHVRRHTWAARSSPQFHRHTAPSARLRLGWLAAAVPSLQRCSLGGAARCSRRCLRARGGCGPPRTRGARHASLAG